MQSLGSKITHHNLRVDTFEWEWLREVRKNEVTSEKRKINGRRESQLFGEGDTRMAMMRHRRFQHALLLIERLR